MKEEREFGDRNVWVTLTYMNQSICRKIVNTKLIIIEVQKLFTEKGAEHHPEFFTNDSSRCTQ